ncbi:Palmitoyl-acyl carrier protein thioesterase, chloroplastic-like protein [Drosera capensis]
MVLRFHHGCHSSLFTFFSVANLASESGAKVPSKVGVVGPSSLNACRIKPKSSASSKGLNVKVNAQAPSKINGTPVVGFSNGLEGVKNDEETSYRSPRTVINQIPDWGMLLAAITTVFLSAEKQWMMLDSKPRRPDMLIDTFGLGQTVEDGLMFRQNFFIRSYEVGVDRTASIETLMNHLQETALNHAKSTGLVGDGFGSTSEMCKRNLIWVVARMQVLVDSYPTW